MPGVQLWDPRFPQSFSYLRSLLSVSLQHLLFSSLRQPHDQVSHARTTVSLWELRFSRTLFILSPVYSMFSLSTLRAVWFISLSRVRGQRMFIWLWWAVFWFCGIFYSKCGSRMSSTTWKLLRTSASAPAPPGLLNCSVHFHRSLSLIVIHMHINKNTYMIGKLAWVEVWMDRLGVFFWGVVVRDWWSLV